MQFIKNMLTKAGIATATLIAATSAHAEVSYTALTGAVDWTVAIAAVLLIMGGVAGFIVVWKGGQKIIQAVKNW